MKLMTEIIDFVNAEVVILQDNYELSREQALKVALHQIKLHPMSDADMYDVQEILDDEDELDC